VPEQLAAIIDRCLAKDPGARFQTAGALASALDDATRFIPQSSSAVVTTESKEPRIISEREARALWSRAAELQSETGVQPALRSLPPSLGAPTVEDRRTLTSGYRLSDVREAATEVGIPERYVLKAQSELGLNTVGSSTGAAAEASTRAAGRGRREVEGAKYIATRVPEQNVLVGAPTSIVCEVEVPKEVRPEDFEVLALTIQRALGDPGHISSLGRSLHWSAAQQQRRLQISVVPRNGRTIIRADERLAPLVGGIFGGLLGGGGGGFGGGMGIPLGIALTHSVAAAFGIFGAIVGGTYLFARKLFASLRRRRERELTNLIDDLAAHIMRTDD
jgi:hypothetical protein